MKKIILYISLGLTITAVSCKKSFLTLAPESSATSATFYKTTNDITEAVTACYQPLQLGTMYLQDFIIMMEVRSDNIEDNNPGADAGREFNVDRFLAGPDNTVFSDAWGAIYADIARCNNVLANLDVVTDPSLKRQYEGEVRFLRALDYFNAVRFWGGIPLVLQPVATQQALTIGRSSVDSIYGAIETDLNKAAALLPSTYNAKNKGRVTAGAATGLLGKVYLTEQKYSQAATTLKQLIPAGTNPYGYVLLPNVADVFSVSNKLNAEILFAVHYDKSIVGQGHAIASYTNQPVFDPNLLNAYEAGDTRRDLLNSVQLNSLTYVMKKYYDTYDPTTNLVGNDFILLRYADVLLMYAEALNEMAYSSDPGSDNFKYLNMVRTRAKATPLTAATLTDQASFRTAVLQERRLELPMEFSRWFDLIRTNTAIQALQNTSLTRITIQSWQYLYPIPDSQIQAMHNPGIFPQNPNYPQ